MKFTNVITQLVSHHNTGRSGAVLKTSPILLFTGPINPVHVLLLIAWGEQVALWFLAINWSSFPLALAGATIATVKSNRNDDGTWKHIPPVDWLSNIVGGTVAAMVFADDLGKLLPALPLLLSKDGTIFIAGLLGWWLCDKVIKMMKTDDPTKNLPTNP